MSQPGVVVLLESLMMLTRMLMRLMMVVSNSKTDPPLLPDPIGSSLSQEASYLLMPTHGWTINREANVKPCQRQGQMAQDTFIILKPDANSNQVCLSK